METIKKNKNNDKYKLSPIIKQQIETLLYTYPSLLQYLEDNQEIMDTLREDGIQEKSKDIIENGSGGGSGKHTSEYEILESKEGQVRRTSKKVQKITNILNRLKEEDTKKFKTDAYYHALELTYFENQTPVEISFTLKISDRSVYRHNSRLLYKIALKLYGDISEEELS